MSASWGFQIGGFATRVARTAKLRALAAGLSVVILAGLLPMPTQAQQRTATEQSLAPYLPGEEFSGLIAGGLFGALNGRNEITNQQQLTGCPPFCMPGFTPNSTANLNGSGFHGGPSAGYNVALPNLIFPNTSLIVGVQGFYSFGSSSNTIPGIPGTLGPSGIATPAIAANDSTSMKFGNNAGIVGKIGTVIPLNGLPVMIAFDGGVGFQRIDLTLNCIGACAANGIPAQSLTDSQTRNGSLIGGEINFPVSRLAPTIFGESNPMIVGFQYLHGDYGTVSTTLGDPAQIQIIANQRLTTDSFMGTLNFQLQRPTAPPAQ